MKKVKIGPITVFITCKGIPSSEKIFAGESGDAIKLLSSDARSKVFDQWLDLLFHTEPRPMIRAAVGTDEKGLVFEIFMWEDRLKAALLAI